MTNICRCGTFQQIRAAIHAAAKRLREARMNLSVPKMNRRAFVIGTAAVGGGSALGFGLRLRRAGAQQSARSSPRTSRPNELGIWVAIKPDDTVAIRIVRAEMGQGSQTGLAQLDRRRTGLRLVEGDDRISDARPTTSKRKRAWGNYQLQRQPRHPRVASIRA